MVTRENAAQGHCARVTLDQLAAAHGVATSYEDWSGAPVDVAPAAVVAALAALGVDADGDEAVARALDDVEQAPWRRLVPATVVVRGGSGTVEVVVPDGAEVGLTVELEDGSRRAVPLGGPVVARTPGAVRRAVPLADLPLGWHALHASAGDRADAAVVVSAPARLTLPQERSWGWMVQLYSLRSGRSWGIGDYADLRTVLDASTADGAGVVLLNPLHAETPVAPIKPSPYSPSSRRFRSPLYLHVEDVPEHAAAPDDVRAAVASLKPTADPDRIPRDPPWAAKLAALELLWPLHREQDLTAWRQAQGAPLEEFALFCALAEVHGVPWQSWPEPLRRPDGPGVPAAREQHAERIAFWCWVQLLVDEQLAGLGEGMAVGVVHDLAVGVDAGGADAWALQDVLALGVTRRRAARLVQPAGPGLGAAAVAARPPGARPATRRSATCCAASCGTPTGCASTTSSGCSACGGCPRAPPGRRHLRLVRRRRAARRAGARGLTAPAPSSSARTSAPSRTEVPAALDATGVLGSAVLWFETDDDGGFLPPSSWRATTLATVTTHDLPTAAGFLAEEQVRVRGRARAARRAGGAGARGRPPASARRCWLCWSGRACSTRPAATCRSRCTRRSPPRPACSCWPRTATPSATCASPTCLAPSTSTRTGGCRSPTATDAR